MNKEYLYLDGKVIIYDEKGIKSLIKYSDNIDDILVTENLIEKMEDNLDKKQKELDQYKTRKKDIKKIALIASIIFVAISVISPYMLVSLIGDNIICETVFGINMNIINVFATAFFPMMTLCAGFEYLSLFLRHKKLTKKAHGFQSEVNFLTKQLKETKEKLTELKNKRKKEIENEFMANFSIKKVNDKEQLEELKKLLYLYHDCGTNAKKYLKYYEDNTLNEKLLNKGYSEYEISLILEYMNDFSKQQISDEKGQSKVLKIKDITSNSI